MKLPEGLPLLPPNTYYGGQLKDHEGEVSGYIFEMGLESWTHFLKGLVGMKDFPNEGSANWHIALPLPEEDEYDKADKIRESQKARIRRDSGKPEEDAIRTKQMGQVYIASDGERSAIGATSGDARQAVKDMQEDIKPEGGMSAQPRETPMTECDECGKPLDAIDAEELHGTCMDCEAKHYVTPCLVQPSETKRMDRNYDYIPSSVANQADNYLRAKGFTATAEALRSELTTMRVEADELREENRRLREWQPIESVPKDGTAVMVKLPGSDIPVIVRWDDALQMAYGPKWVNCWDGELLGWFELPTHWFPLPTAPENHNYKGIEQ